MTRMSPPFISVLTLITCACARAAIAGATDIPAGAVVVPLWPVQPVTQPNYGEVVVDERGKNGQHDRVITVASPSLTVFLPEHTDANRPAVIICPGGGYVRLAIDHEGYAVATWLNQMGVAAFVLKYRMPGRPATADMTPLPIQDVRRAIRMVRARAKEWNVEASRVGVMGFSAGGHVASTAATQFDDGDASATDAVERQSSRPDFAVLMYPVVSMRDGIAHGGSRNRLLGEHPDASQIDRFSGELHITEKTPPLFLVHARDDKAVIPKNSELFAEAAKRAGVPCELTLINTGGHGFGLGKPGSEASQWPAKCEAWLRERGILSAK
jgi:acetyl esterase/lipase